MKRFKLYIFLAVLLISSAPDAAAAETRFRPEQFFAGRTRSSGVFANTVGKSRQDFTTECRGRRRGDTLWLDQIFRYDDGRTQRRRWQIRRIDAVHYVGRANDVVGEARGKVDGATFQFAYIVALKPGNQLFQRPARTGHDAATRWHGREPRYDPKTGRRPLARDGAVSTRKLISAVAAPLCRGA